jgi:hypothetical protein
LYLLVFMSFILHFILNLFFIIIKTTASFEAAAFLLSDIVGFI